MSAKTRTSLGQGFSFPYLASPIPSRSVRQPRHHDPKSPTPIPHSTNSPTEPMGSPYDCTWIPLETVVLSPASGTAGVNKVGGSKPGVVAVVSSGVGGVSRERRGLWEDCVSCFSVRLAGFIFSRWSVPPYEASSPTEYYRLSPVASGSPLYDAIVILDRFLPLSPPTPITSTPPLNESLGHSTQA